MKKNSLIDYAYPMMMAERKLKEAHDALLEHDYDVGIARLLECAAEAKIAVNSVRHMKESTHAVRKQA